LILIDANILIYAYSSSSPHHLLAKDWLEDAINQRLEIGLPWVVLLAFMRIMTSKLPFKITYSREEVIQVIDDLLTQSNVTVLEPSGNHWSVLKNTLVTGQVSRNLFNDAHLAALSIEHEATICSTDLDFSRFDGLRLINPISRQ
jgi:uncharacterized protein